MMKIIRVLKDKSLRITCEFNNGTVKELDVKPLIEQHKHLMGIEKLYQERNFANVKIGAMGELLWENVITISYNQQQTLLDYDISPEFAYQIAK